MLTQAIFDRMKREAIWTPQRLAARRAHRAAAMRHYRAAAGIGCDTERKRQWRRRNPKRDRLHFTAQNWRRRGIPSRLRAQGVAVAGRLTLATCEWLMKLAGER